MQRLDAEGGVSLTVFGGRPHLFHGSWKGARRAKRCWRFLKPLGEQSHQMSLTLPEMPGVAAEELMGGPPEDPLERVWAAAAEAPAQVSE